MVVLQLDNGFSFAIEHHEKRVRLIVYKDGVENVCRMETFKNVGRFILSGEEKIFKGRLQLHRNGGVIAIEAKGRIVGTVKVDEFAGYLKKVKETSDISIDQK